MMHEKFEQTIELLVEANELVKQIESTNEYTICSITSLILFPNCQPLLEQFALDHELPIVEREYAHEGKTKRTRSVFYKGMEIFTYANKDKY